VNLEAELVSALEKIDRLTGKNKKQKEQLRKYEKNDHDLDKTGKNNYHLEDSTRRSKNYRRSGEKPTERKGIKL
jgi:hypothetical protein